MSAESSKKPFVAAPAPAASQKAVVQTAAGVADPARLSCVRGSYKARAAAPVHSWHSVPLAGGLSAASTLPARHSTQALRLTVPSMAPSEAFGAD